MNLESSGSHSGTTRTSTVVDPVSVPLCDRRRWGIKTDGRGEDETVGTRVPILLGVEDIFKRSDGCEQFAPRGVGNKFVGFPDAWADLDGIMY